jgi:hypothetical protein
MKIPMQIIQFDSIRFNREFDSNEIDGIDESNESNESDESDESDENDLNLEKHDSPTFSTSAGISICDECET